MPHTEQVRSFNRFYTKQIGLLREGLLQSPFSLTQARVIYELGSAPGARSSELVETLGLDPGYLSRLLKSFEDQGLIKRWTSKQDRRVNLVSLTSKGRKEFEKLNTQSEAEIGGMLAALSGAGQQRLVESMNAIRELLGSNEPAPKDFVLRAHRAGDIGWVIGRHGELYTQEYGWDSTFEGLVGEIAGKFLKNFDSKRERCWIADEEWRAAGMRVSGPAIEHSGEASYAAGGAVGSRDGRGEQAGGRMYRVCAAVRVSQADVMDQRHSARGAEDLCASGVPLGEGREASQFWA